MKAISDWLVILIAVALPWSTSAVSMLVVAWLISLLPTVSVNDLRRELATPASGFAVVLFILGATGMLWADVSWQDRLGGLDGFMKLLVIPLLAVQFRYSERADVVLKAFLLACVALLLGSFAVTIWADLRGLPNPGVVVKAYIVQSIEFAMCAAVLLDRAVAEICSRKWAKAAALSSLSLAFLADIIFIVTGRTALVVILALVLLYGFRKSGWKGVVAAVLVAVITSATAWVSSPYLRSRVVGVYTESESYLHQEKVTSAGERIAFWTRSLEFIRLAPLIGHGTGSITQLFKEAAAGQKGPLGEVSTNPHNQTFAVGIQLGVLGIVILWAMWIAQLKVFWQPGFIAWVGMVVVVQNVVGSFFNSFIFDFTEGWIYAFGAGVALGMQRKAGEAETRAGVGISELLD